MSVKSTIGTTIDIAALIGGSAITVGGIYFGVQAIKSKNSKVIVGSILVTLVGIYATKQALESIRKKD